MRCIHEENFIGFHIQIDFNHCQGLSDGLFLLMFIDSLILNDFYKGMGWDFHLFAVRISGGSTLLRTLQPAIQYLVFSNNHTLLPK